VLLPGLLVVPALAGEAASAGEWRLLPWGRDVVQADLPKPGSDLPAPGTLLPPFRPGRNGATVDAAPPRPPEASLLADPRVQAARKLQDSLTDAQRAALGQIMAENKDRLVGMADRHPKPPVELPTSQAQADRLRADRPARLDTAALKAADAEIRAEIARTNAQIARILTPEQRALFEQSLPGSMPESVQAVTGAGSTSNASTATETNASVATETSASTSTQANVSVTTESATNGRGPGRDDSDKEVKMTRSERRQRERTNAGGLDDYHTEGNVLALRCAAAQPVPDALAGPVSFDVNEVPYAVIATRDGLQQIRLHGETGKLCDSIKAGEYLVVDGTKQSESVFDAEELDSEPVLR
jgi:Spy/CpxP family protein refolding chaperone